MVRHLGQDRAPNRLSPNRCLAKCYLIMNTIGQQRMNCILCPNGIHEFGRAQEIECPGTEKFRAEGEPLRIVASTGVIFLNCLSTGCFQYAAQGSVRSQSVTMRVQFCMFCNDNPHVLTPESSLCDFVDGAHGPAVALVEEKVDSTTAVDITPAARNPNTLRSARRRPFNRTSVSPLIAWHRRNSATCFGAVANVPLQHLKAYIYEHSILIMCQNSSFVSHVARRMVFACC
jgi:hypothetical protein